MASGGAVEHSVNLDKVQSDLGMSTLDCNGRLLIIDKLWELVNSQPSITPAQKSAIKSMYGEVIKSLGQSTSPETAAVELPGVTRAKGTKQRRSSSQFLRPNVEDKTEVEEAHMPFLHLKRKTGTSWAYSHKFTNICESV
jgi:fatty acid synthase subunit alpha